MRTTEGEDGRVGRDDIRISGLFVERLLALRAMMEFAHEEPIVANGF